MGNFMNKLEQMDQIYGDKSMMQTNIKSDKLHLEALLERKNALLNPEAILTDDSKTHLGGSSSDKDSIKGVSIAGAGIRNVTVNIENLIRENIINAQSSEKGVQDLAAYITEVVVRAVRDAELTLSSN